MDQGSGHRRMRGKEGEWGSDNGKEEGGGG